MGNNLNKLLLRQIKRHFGQIDRFPEDLKGFIRDISNTYEGFEDDARLLQNSIEISSQELRDANLKHRHDAERQKKTINKIKEAIYALNPSGPAKLSDIESIPSDSSYLFDSLIKLIQQHKQAEEEILKLSKAVEQNPASIVITNTDGEIEYVNRKFCDLTGYTREEVLGQNPRILKADNSSTYLFIELWDTILAGNEWQGELQNKKKNGEFYWESALISPIFNENRQITHFIAIKEDITARKKAEEERKRQTGLITSLLDSIPDIIFFKDSEGIYLGCNPPFAEFIGKSKEEIVGKSDYDLFDKEVADLFRYNDVEMLRQKSSRHNEEWITYPDGRRILIETLKTPYWAGDGNLIGILGISRDITKRKQAEEALEQSSQKWEAIISASPDGIGMVSLDGKLQLMSEKLALIHGYSTDQREAFLDKTIFDFIDPSNHQLLADNMHKLLTGQKEQKITEYLAIRQDKSTFYIDVNSTILYDAQGDPESLLFIERDITESKKAEELLNNERALFRTIIDLIPDAVYVKDTEGRKMLANPKEVQFAGKYSEQEIIGKTDADLYPGNESIRSNAEDQYVIQTGKSIVDVEGKLIDREGKEHSLLISKVPLRDIHGKITGLVGVSHDISTRKQTEDQLKQISTRLSLAARAGGVGVWDLDLDHDFLIWDDQMFALYGIDKRNIFGPYNAWLALIFPDDIMRVDQQIKMALNGEKEFDTEFRVVWPDSSVHNIRALATVQRDNLGKPIHIIGTNWDITEQKRIEETLLIAKEESDSANRAKSEFLANMSHEIRTPLNGVIGFTDLLLRTPLNKIQQQYAKNANTSGHSLLGIINDILDFSKIEAGKMEIDWIKGDIIELAELTSDILKYHASQKNIELLLNIQQDIPRFVIMDPTRLKQILVNLLGNAVKFTEAGEVELKVTFEKTDEKYGAFLFSVRDTGIGINSEQQKHLFKAFSQADQSTTRKFGGTGLGLTISNMLAEKMGTKIELISEPGKGSNFFFTLRTAYEFGEKPDLESLSAMKRLLVIDDNFNNRMILEHTCKFWGIDFVGTDNGHTAIQLLETSKPFDVIIVDYQMPEINGLDTIKLIRSRLNLTPEEQPVILLHSSSDDIKIYEECKQLGVIFNLTKPVKSSELLHYLKNIHCHPNALLFDPEIGSLNDLVNLTQDVRPGILVAEDVVINMILVTTLIRQMIPNVILYEAKNGQEAFEIAVSKKPDLIFMDIQMPVMSGVESTLAIRKFELGKGNRIPIVALTAGAIKGEEERCMEAGMDDFLTKPLEHNKLHKILGKHLVRFYQHSVSILKKDTTDQGNIHFDRSMLMNSIGDNETLLDELLVAVQKQFEKDSALLQKAITGRNLAEIKVIAHSIKGACLNMWFNKMAELAIEFELYLDKDHYKELEELYEELMTEWEKVQTLFSK